MYPLNMVIFHTYYVSLPEGGEHMGTLWKIMINLASLKYCVCDFHQIQSDISLFVTLIIFNARPSVQGD